MKVLFTVVLFIIITINVFCQNNTNVLPLNDRYALIIGISNYQISANNLKFASKDANDFKDALLKNGRFNKDNVKLLIDKDASRENIRKCLEGWLKGKVKKNDLVIIYFSGHGTQIVDTDGDEDDGLDECLVPYDFDSDDYSSVITDDMFAFWIRNLISEKVFIIFDNCYSGGASKQKGVTLSGIKGNIGKDDFTKDITREIPRKGTALLAASKADQVSFESNEFQNGIFTYYLLNSISSTSDLDLNKIINSKELYLYTKQKTLEYSKNNFNKEQEPIFINSIQDDLNIFYLTSVQKTKILNKKIDTLNYKYEQERDYSKKLKIYKEIYDTDPYNPEYNLRLAFLYEVEKNYVKAIELYQYILTIKNSSLSYHPSTLAKLGELYNKIGEKDLALSYYSQSIQEDPQYPSTFNAIASIYLSKNDTLSAIQNLNKSLEIQPFQKGPYLSLFYIYMEMNNFDTACKIIKSSYLINSNDYETLYWNAMVEKYINKNSMGDSLLAYFQNNSGIRKIYEEINDTTPSTYYRVNGKEMTYTEYKLYTIKHAIEDYPYYDEFYKIYIKLINVNNISEDISGYMKKYLRFSKFNLDNTFITKNKKE